MPIILPEYGAFLQFSVAQGDVAANMAAVAAGLARLAPAAGTLVVLPELWATGFAYHDLPALAARTGEVLDFLTGLAARYDIVLAGSLPEAVLTDSKPIFHNTLFLVHGGGLAGSCRKSELFAPMGEDVFFTPGRGGQPVPTPLGLIGGLVCFDLRFPLLAWELSAGGAAVLAVSAQWPWVRRDQWRALVIARAIENQVYVVACNRTGTTGELIFGGGSLIVAPDGTVLAEAGEEEEVACVRLDPELLATIRSRFRTAGVTPARRQAGDKILSLDAAIAAVGRYKTAGRRIVFTNGCFDLLHAGHVTYLEKARQLGDLLIVAMNSDQSVRMLKGPSRPVNNQEHRALVLAGLESVDLVVIFDDPTPLAVITALLPHFLVKGSDWAVADIVGSREVLAADGQVATIDFYGTCSTTRIINSIRSGSGGSQPTGHRSPD